MIGGEPLSGSTIVDILLVLTLIGALVSGFRSGLVRSLSGILGLVAGSIAAFFVVPLVGAWVPAPEWRTAATLAAALLLIVLGVSIGASVGHALRRSVHRSRLRVIDRMLGMALTLVASALVASMVAFSIGALGVPYLSPAIATSDVLRTIDRTTPDPVKGLLAQLRTLVTEEGLPLITEAFTGPNPELPEFETSNPALAEAAQSVLKITGNAYACGQNQSGSGFVVAPDRVVTNAHVVAGVTEPIVQAPGGAAVAGRVVYFDPVDDLAIIATDGLAAPPLQRIDASLTAGSRAVTDGYPFGGPFDSDPAEVISVGPLTVADIYGDNPTPRQVYTLAADVQQGESGGPLLTETGLVAGVIFAKGATTPNVGYALAMEEVEPVAAAAASLSEPVAAGSCAR